LEHQVNSVPDHLMIALHLFLIALGFVLLTKGADFLVNGSTAIAKRFKMSDMAIGLTIVAMGTSLPEMVVSILAGLKGQGDVAIGNVVGSNIVNILLVLGITGTIGGLMIQKNTIRFEIPLSIGFTILLLLLANGFQWNQAATGLSLSRVDGLILLVGFVGFMAYVAMSMKSGAALNFEEGAKMPIYKSLLLLLLGITGLGGGGKLVVDHAVTLAQMAEIPERIIGLTIVAIGTSLPELATSVVAAMQKKLDIAIGNVVGSNIFNIALILGLSSAVHPIAYNVGFNTDILVVLIASILLWFFSAFGFQKNMLERWEAIILLLCFVGYSAWLVLT
jgi:cation:H+ antiporter